MRTVRNLLLLLAVGIHAAAYFGGAQDQPAKLKALIIDGQNNHAWQQTTPVLKAILEEGGRFAVDVATSPPGEDLTGFAPEFASYDVVVSNYNGALWSEPTRKAFVEYVSGGGGFVSVHAANNSFPQWPEYNAMIGLGGWGGRNEESGPYLRWRDGKAVKVADAGRGGSHGPRHEFLVEIRNPDHPAVSGLPSRWMHAEDELYDRLRGPAEEITILGTAYSSPEKSGTGENEPMLMAVRYGDGRVFHTTLGHDVKAMSGAGFQESLRRGTEWAAVGKVTFPDAAAGDLPEDRVVYREVPVASP